MSVALLHVKKASLGALPPGPEYYACSKMVKEREAQLLALLGRLPDLPLPSPSGHSYYLCDEALAVRDQQLAAAVAVASNGSMGLKHVALVLAGVAVGAAVMHYSMKGGRSGLRQNPRSSRTDLDIASDPTTRSAELARMAKLRDPKVRKALALNPSTPIVTLRALAMAGFADDVVNNPILPLARMEGMDGIDALDGAIVRNTKNDDTLWAIYRGASEETLGKLADSLYAPPALLEKLSHSEDQSVRWYVASNNNTPLATLERMFRNDNDFVSKAAGFSIKRKSEV